jgi:hypothetical protein
MLNRNTDINRSDDSSIEYLIKRYMGTVVDVNDPLKEGRCRVRVHGLFDSLAIEDIPWANPGTKSTFFGKEGAASISIPKNGALVVVRFDQGDIYSPEYEQLQELAKDLQEELKKDGEYLGSHFILWDGDEALKLWFTVGKGLTFENKASRINIAQDSKITIEHKETQSIIELEGPTIKIVANSTVDITATSEVRVTSEQVWLRGDFTRLGASGLTEPAVMGDALMATIESLASMIDGKLPSTPGLAKGVVSLAKPLILSDTVTVGK